jgi:uncharacterized lipoprotein
MKRFRTPFTMVLLLTLLAACTSGPQVRSDFDHSANFASYKTFGFVSPLGTDVDGYSTLITQRLKSATQREMEARGYRYTESDPDLLVNFSARLAKKVQVDPLASQQIGYYSYRRVGVYRTWPSYAYQNNVDEYTEGTLNIDLVDAKRKQLVWEGVAVGRVTDDKLANPEPAIDKAVADIFAKYTYRAAP